MSPADWRSSSSVSARAETLLIKELQESDNPDQLSSDRSRCCHCRFSSGKPPRRRRNSLLKIRTIQTPDGKNTAGVSAVHALNKLQEVFDSSDRIPVRWTGLQRPPANISAAMQPGVFTATSACLGLTNSSFLRTHVRAPEPNPFSNNQRNCTEISSGKQEDCKLHATS